MITGIHTLQNRSITTIKPKSCEHFSFSKGVACVLNTRNAFQLRYFAGCSISNSINHYIYRWKLRVWKISQTKSNPAFFSTFAVSLLRRTDFFSFYSLAPQSQFHREITYDNINNNQKIQIFYGEYGEWKRDRNWNDIDIIWHTNL